MKSSDRWQPNSVEEYLARDADGGPWYELVSGFTFRRPDETNRHNLISSNVFGSIAHRLRGGEFRAWTSATRIRIELPRETRFYHPDGSVIGQASFHDEPDVVYEVVSAKSYRTDLCEKKDAYLTIPSLRVYTLIDQDLPLVVVFRRSNNGFDREVYEGLDAVVPLPEIEAEMPLAEVYAGVEFIPETADDE